MTSFMVKGSQHPQRGCRAGWTWWSWWSWWTWSRCRKGHFSTKSWEKTWRNHEKGEISWKIPWGFKKHLFFVGFHNEEIFLFWNLPFWAVLVIWTYYSFPTLNMAMSVIYTGFWTCNLWWGQPLPPTLVLRGSGESGRWTFPWYFHYKIPDFCCSNILMTYIPCLDPNRHWCHHQARPPPFRTMSRLRQFYIINGATLALPSLLELLVACRTRWACWVRAVAMLHNETSVLMIIVQWDFHGDSWGFHNRDCAINNKDFTIKNRGLMFFFLGFDWDIMKFQSHWTSRNMDLLVTIKDMEDGWEWINESIAMKYHLVICCIAMEKPNHKWRFSPLGNSSISMGHGFHGYVSHNQRVQYLDEHS